MLAGDRDFSPYWRLRHAPRPNILSDLTFYFKLLRFVADKTERNDPRVAAMMDLLVDAADAFEAAGAYRLPADRLPLAARAFAGVAAFLQRQILPSVVADQNTAGERQIRWAIDTAMASVNSLLMQATAVEGASVTLVLDGSIDR